MPTFAFKTQIRSVSDNPKLDLVVWHRMFSGEPSAATRVVKNPPPKGVDIIMVSPLTINMSGMLNDNRISADVLISSHIAQHLPEYLKLNSTELGFEMISDVRTAKETGRVTFFCTASRPSRPMEAQSPHLKLLGFDIDYSWHETPFRSPPGSQSSSGFLDGVFMPFSSRLSLPYITVLNNAVERFVTSQMVKRYPCIFGSWSQQFDIEKSFTSSMFTSINNISRRSSNSTFQESCRTLLKLLGEAMFASQVDLDNRLSGYLNSLGLHEGNNILRPLVEDEESIFSYAVERVYCISMKRPFRSVSVSQNWPIAVSDDIFCDQEPLYTGFEEEPHFSTSDDEDFPIFWDGRSTITDDSLSMECESDFVPLELPSPSLGNEFLDIGLCNSPDLFSCMRADLNSAEIPPTPACLENIILASQQFYNPITNSDSVRIGLDTRQRLESLCTDDYRQDQCSVSSELTDLLDFPQDMSNFTLVTEDDDDDSYCESVLYFASDEDSLEGPDELVAPSANIESDSSINDCTYDFVAMEF